MINTIPLNVSLRSFTPLCFPYILAADLQSIILDSNDMVGIRRKLENVDSEAKDKPKFKAL
jgi:hypothetical protein